MVVVSIVAMPGPSGLGIMIIEGRHTEAGRGIFVSDLQEGSAAEQAAAKLKQTEGVVVLTVCSPNMKDPDDAAAAKLKQTEDVVVLTVCSPNMKDPDDAAAAKLKQTEDVVVLTVCSPNMKDPDDAAAAKLKQTEGVVVLTVCSPNMKDPDDAAAAKLKQTEGVVVLTVCSPNMKDPDDAAAGSSVLGVVLLGGSDTHVNGAAAIILDVYKDGCIAKDGRLQAGDQILDCNGLKMLVHRPDPHKFDQVEVELARKPGKPLGITCVAPVLAPGVYLGHMLPGSPAELDGRLQKGDLLVSVDGKDLSSADLMTAATAFKLCGNKVNIKVKRFKTVR
ncbi:Inactivation-no-after-potential D protein [Operophtera brumata]|uniref:Inactivation-no-after-potential D protein n=1 Tax=Operophtera brumata TaxID=104452 RepID=A0A0L7LBS2_OPEBR|nr:Inactivation-no-after-potential D protein [Operophtera brumata]